MPQNSSDPFAPVYGQDYDPRYQAPVAPPPAPYENLPPDLQEFFSQGPYDNQSFAFSQTGPAQFTPNQLYLQGLATSQGANQLSRRFDAEKYQRALRGQLSTPYDQISSAGQQAQSERSAALNRQSQLDQLFADEMERLQTGPNATPEQKALIGQIAEGRIESGKSDIQAALQESLGLLRSELAPSRGFRPEDTPIQDRGQVLARESLRLTEDLISQARQDQAQQLLEYPLAESQLRGQQFKSISDIGTQQSQFGRGLGLSLSQFQDQLRTNDLSRRLAVGEQGLQLASLGPTNIGQFTPPGASSYSVSGSKGENPDSRGGSSSGQFAQGIGSAIGAAIIASSRKIKENKTKVDYSAVLEKLKSLDIERWNYTFDPEQSHIGPYAEDFNQLFEVGVDDRISVVDQGGVTFAAIKALLKRVEELEAKVNV
jgi:hypothetical protein